MRVSEGRKKSLFHCNPAGLVFLIGFKVGGKTLRHPIDPQSLAAFILLYFVIWVVAVGILTWRYRKTDMTRVDYIGWICLITFGVAIGVWI
jgi:hypothetical protein|tara:strand:+ start:326 stop:598 length:273 start_codon:yes stop_codon:yes gene_type:complete